MVRVVVEFSGKAYVEVDETLVTPDTGSDLDATIRHIAEDEVAVLSEVGIADVRIYVETSWIEN